MKNTLRQLTLIGLLLTLSSAPISLSRAQQTIEAEHILRNVVQSPIRSVRWVDENRVLLVTQTSIYTYDYSLQEWSTLYTVNHIDQQLHLFEEGYAYLSDENGVVYIIDVSSGEEISQFQGHSGFILNMDLNASRTLLAVVKECATTHCIPGTQDSIVNLISVPDGKLLHEYNSLRSISTAFSPDSSMLATTSATREVVIWDIESGNPLYEYSGRGELGFSSDGNTFAFVAESEDISGGLVGFVELATETVVYHSLQSNGLNILSICPNSNLVLTSARTEDIHISEVNSGRLLYILEHNSRSIEAVDFGNSCQKIIGISDNNIYIWKLPVHE